MIFTLINKTMPAESFDILRATLTRRLHERSCALGEEGYTLTLALDHTFTDDRYRIEPIPGGISLTAANAAALWAATGRFLHASRFDGNGGFLPTEDIIDFTPASPLRGMYFATHFYNFYHNAPIERVYEVIEDLALRGCNVIQVWYDMHHFSGIDDPASRELIDRLKAFMRHAKQIGMMVSMTMLSNEAFNTSPEHLRADWQAQGNYFSRIVDHYHIEICPSKPGGMEEILAERRAMFEAFADVNPDFACFWPYDQGGCTCTDCAPWGANGMLKILPRFRALLNELWPSARIIYSTWYFDSFIHGEWDAFYPHLTDGSLDGVDYIMSFFFRGELPAVLAERGIPDGVRFVDFPEISMYSCVPWGGFGANPLARFLDETDQKSAHLYSGGFPYSEGIFEDINKQIVLFRYNGRNGHAADAVREWARFELCCDDEALVDAILRTETALARTGRRGETGPCYTIKDTSDVDAVWAIISDYDQKLPAGIRTLPRWRMIYLRALLDYELPRADGQTNASQRVRDAFLELYGYYYASPKTHRWVCPPVIQESEQA